MNDDRGFLIFVSKRFQMVIVSLTFFRLNSYEF